MISVVAQSARGSPTARRRRSTRSSSRAAPPPPTRFLLEWRGEADPKHVRAIDTYWICTAEHGLNASTFTARVVASTGADCAAALSSAVGALSGPLHGGAPARVLPMLDGAAAARLDRGLRQGPARQRRPPDGLRPPRLPRRGPARAAAPRHRAWISARRASRSPRSSSGPRSPSCTRASPTACSRRTSSSGRRSCSTSPTVPPSLAPAMFACSRTAGWSAHVLEQKRLGRLVRPSAVYVGPGPRSLGSS